MASGIVRQSTSDIRQRACKPGSVQRIARLCGHSSRRRVTPSLKQPTRATSRNRPICRPYSVLHPVGFSVPATLPPPRCALAAPFRPYPPKGGRYAFCGTFPRYPYEYRPGVTRHRCSVEPGLSSPRLREPRPPGPLAGRIWVIAASAATGRAISPGTRRR
jgi:hypothetical protein